MDFSQRLLLINPPNRANTLLHHLHIVVYIEAEVCGPGAKGKFEVDDKDMYNPEKPNSKLPVREAFKEFMASDVNVLLLSGAAGSGKSTAYSKLQMWVLNEYTRQRKEKVSHSLPYHVNRQTQMALYCASEHLENKNSVTEIGVIDSILTQSYALEQVRKQCHAFV